MEEQQELYIYVNFSNPEHVKVYDEFFANNEEAVEAKEKLDFVIFEFYSGMIIAQSVKGELYSDSILSITDVTFEKK